MYLFREKFKVELSESQIKVLLNAASRHNHNDFLDLADFSLLVCVLI